MTAIRFSPRWRSTEVAFLAIELKTPSTPINDPIFFADAIEKVQHWDAGYMALWNMCELEVYPTPAHGQTLLPSEAISRSALPLAISQVEDWLKPAFAKELRNQAVEILDAAVLHHASGKLSDQTIHAESSSAV